MCIGIHFNDKSEKFGCKFEIVRLKYWTVANWQKVLYRIGYRYWQISVIHYRLSECQLNSILVHHWKKGS